MELREQDKKRVIYWIMERVARSEQDPALHAVNREREQRLRAFIRELRDGE